MTGKIQVLVRARDLGEQASSAALMRHFLVHCLRGRQSHPQAPRHPALRRTRRALSVARLQPGPAFIQRPVSGRSQAPPLHPRTGRAGALGPTARPARTRVSARRTARVGRRPSARSWIGPPPPCGHTFGLAGCQPFRPWSSRASPRSAPRSGLGAARFRSGIWSDSRDVHPPTPQTPRSALKRLYWPSAGADDDPAIHASRKPGRVRGWDGRCPAFGCASPGRGVVSSPGFAMMLTALIHQAHASRCCPVGRSGPSCCSGGEDRIGGVQAGEDVGPATHLLGAPVASTDIKAAHALMM